MRRAAPLLVVIAAACGGAPRPTPSPSPEASTAAAMEAWARRDPALAAREAERALALGGDRDAAEVAARAHLALGRWAAAIRATEGASDPTLLRLRASAQIASGDFAAAAAAIAAAARHAREEDPYLEAIGPAARAAAGGAYELLGERAELPLEPLPLPVVRVRVDAIETYAIVGTGAFLAVLDPAVRARAGVIDELGLGALRVLRVPHTVRSLEAMREALGVDVGMVIGADLLRRLSATLDGPGQRLLVAAAPPPPSGATSAALYPLSGSFLAIEAHRGDHASWLTLDSAGLYPVALSPSGVVALGLEEAAWEETDAGAQVTVAHLRIGALAIEALPIVRGLIGEEHARAIEAPVGGSVGWTLLSQLRVRFARDEARVYFE